MRLLTLVAAVSLAFAAAGCDRNTTTTPSPKTDTSSRAPSAAAGSSATSAAPSTAEKREGSNPQQGQVDPKHENQHRDFRNSGDGAGPKSPDTAPTMKN